MGSVIPTLGAIIPAAVGVDIGCGMIAVRTQFALDDVKARGDLAALREAIERAIPLSAGMYNSRVYDEPDRGADRRAGAARGGRQRREDRAELAVPAGQPRLGQPLHRGEPGRGRPGLAVPALRLTRRRQQAGAASTSRSPAHWRRSGGSPCPTPTWRTWPRATGEFWAYIRDLRWAQHFALLNREEMMHRLADCVTDWIGRDVEPGETVNTHHNYTERETHFGKEVWLSRKGAIDASAGTPGLIPGSMGTRSYVVTGKGNRLALNSSPHGAGREYSRSAARQKFSREELDAAMAGIEWRHTDAFLDEIPAAYKDIDVVMADAADLVEVRHVLRQIVNVKGDSRAARAGPQTATPPPPTNSNHP